LLQSIIRNGTIVLASILLAVAYNVFVLPMNFLNGGVTGLAMLTDKLIGLNNTGLIILVFNIPIFILGFVKLGKKFVAKSVLSVVVTTLAMQICPLEPIVQSDGKMLAAVFGGTIIGISIGLVLRAGGSTGGFDILGVVLTQRREFPLGDLIFALNAVVVALSGLFSDWEAALYTMVIIFVSSKVIDKLHTRHIKLTLMIITTRGPEMRQRLIEELYRGVTVLDVEGGFSQKKRKMLMMVISRIELEDVKRLIHEIDPTAFVNITQTREVMGLFYRDSPFKRPVPREETLALPPATASADEQHTG
jgi:uncharacterized membrane-anchored protein YitT (DUF2179 family)